MLTWKPSSKDIGYPVNYYVPNFGVDVDMVATKNHYEEQEKKMGHFWDVLKPAPKPHPVDYFVPHFGTDPEIMASMQNLNDQEKVNGVYDLPPKDYVPSFAQLDSKSKREPLLTW